MTDRRPPSNHFCSKEVAGAAAKTSLWPRQTPGSHRLLSVLVTGRWQLGNYPIFGGHKVVVSDRKRSVTGVSATCDRQISVLCRQFCYAHNIFVVLPMRTPAMLGHHFVWMEICPLKTDTMVLVLLLLLLILLLLLLLLLLQLLLLLLLWFYLSSGVKV